MKFLVSHYAFHSAMLFLLYVKFLVFFLFVGLLAGSLYLIFKYVNEKTVSLTFIC